jgi:hypothetical protein
MTNVQFEMIKEYQKEIESSGEGSIIIHPPIHTALVDSKVGNLLDVPSCPLFKSCCVSQTRLKEGTIRNRQKKNCFLERKAGLKSYLLRRVREGGTLRRLL